MAELFGVSRSAYYRFCKYDVSMRQDAIDAQLIDLIRKIRARHRYYGSPRMRRELRDRYGKCISPKKVARLMRENGLNVKRGRKYVKTTDSKWICLTAKLSDGL
jgi:transposase InsO family protein